MSWPYCVRMCSATPSTIDCLWHQKLVSTAATCICQCDSHDAGAVTIYRPISILKFWLSCMAYTAAKEYNCVQWFPVYPVYYIVQLVSLRQFTIKTQQLGLSRRLTNDEQRTSKASPAQPCTCRQLACTSSCWKNTCIVHCRLASLADHIYWRPKSLLTWVYNLKCICCGAVHFACEHVGGMTNSSTFLTCCNNYELTACKLKRMHFFVVFCCAWVGLDKIWVGLMQVAHCMVFCALSYDATCRLEK